MQGNGLVESMNKNVINIIKNTISENNGNYRVSYDYPQCLPGSTITIYASFNGASGTTTGTMQPTGETRLAVALVNVTIPEFSTLTAAIAFFFAGGSYLFLRKKKAIN